LPTSTQRRNGVDYRVTAYHLTFAVKCPQGFLYDTQITFVNYNDNDKIITTAIIITTITTIIITVMIIK